MTDEQIRKFREERELEQHEFDKMIENLIGNKIVRR